MPRTLHVISCSARKVWAARSGDVRYRDARDAYLGNEIRAWLQDGRSSTERWVILSAKYGFIEPDHPIADYDVTFADQSTGPLPFSALREQVLHQRRWEDKTRLRDFDTVIVHGAADYLLACRHAFEGVAVVKRDTGVERITSNHALPAFSSGAALAIGTALRQLPSAVFENFDRAEPEWPVLEVLARWPHPNGLMATLALALCDYQLGPGGAEAYWRDVAEILRANAVPKSTAQLRSIVEQVLNRPVSSRMAVQKGERINRLLVSSFVREVKADPFEVIGRNPMALWERLSKTMGQKPDAKTIAFSMKLFDLLHLIKVGAYLSFSTPVPIVADLRIARISYASGLVAPPGGTSVLGAVEQAAQLLAGQQDQFIAAWEQVGQKAGGLSLFRVDSLAWQLADPIFRTRHQPSMLPERIKGVLTQRGADPSSAATVAAALSAGMVSTGRSPLA